jgi:hypothetical protein
MKLEERDVTDTEMSRLSWVLLYLFALLAVLDRIAHAWSLEHTHPLVLWSTLSLILGVVSCFLPLLFGVIFRGDLKREFSKGGLSTKAYYAFDQSLVWLLYVIYLAMVVYR